MRLYSFNMCSGFERETSVVHGCSYTIGFDCKCEDGFVLGW